MNVTYYFPLILLHLSWGSTEKIDSYNAIMKNSKNLAADILKT